MPIKDIIIKGAREHNLKNIDVTIPRDRFVVITGLSGSGKSTLAFDTIYAEGQRRYVESLSAYARQFLGVMHKPDVDSIDGLSPAISIEQKTTSKNPRSTVGTVTEIYDYLRLLFARIGIMHCYKCHVPIEPQTPDMIVNRLIEHKKGCRIQILAPVIRQKKGTYEKEIENLQKQGFSKVRIDGTAHTTDEKVLLKRYEKHDIEAVVDKILIPTNPDKDARSRLQDSIEQALKLANGFVIVEDQGKDMLFSSHASCPSCDISFEDIEPRMFSFNSPFGACETCHGLGVKMEFDPDLIIPDKSKCIAEGAIVAYNNHIDGWRGQQLASVAKHTGFSVLTPLKDLKKEHTHVLLFGSTDAIHYQYKSKDATARFEHQGGWEGVIPQLQRLYHKTESEYRRNELEKFMLTSPCPICHGKRLKQKVLSVLIDSKSIIDVTNLSIKDTQNFFKILKLTQKQEHIAHQVLKEISARLEFLCNVGLGYLTLSRAAGTLSGGEAQRIRLATQIGSQLMGVLYILDEPSIGLHQRDNAKLINTLHRLRDLGNTVLVVEHDEDTIKAADYVIDIGPGAGIHGGKIVACGTPQEITQNQESLTGKYLSRKCCIPIPKKRRLSTKYIKIKDAWENNLKHIDVQIPLNTLTAITGVSGSGKSTLVHEVLYKAIAKKLYHSKERPGNHKSVILDDPIDKVIVIDQSPIGRTPRSNPATYTKLFDEIRKLFAMTKEARVRGYKEGRFSFNVKGGRCEACEGDGLIRIEMNFLPDVYVECEHCKGARYNTETLQVYYKGRNISNVLNMTVDEAYSFFEHVPSIQRKLQTLQDVGLGYIHVGQSSTTLSGGEAQRIKLTRELSKKDTGHTLYILDEPTTGLHFEDVKKLLSVLDRLVEKQNTVVVIEHNLDVIKTADYIIDLGPQGGDDGGEIVAIGSPEEIAKNPKSYTGCFLKKVLL